MSGPATTPLSETSVDRELEAALAVDPSPEFLARVRARIAIEPAPRAWRSQWVPRLQWTPLGAVLAAVLVVAAAVSVSRIRQDRLHVTAGDRTPLPSKPIGLAATLMTNPESRIARYESRLPNPKSRVPVPESRIPTPGSRVLISRAESDALWQAVVIAREGLIVMSSASAETSQAPVSDADGQPRPEIAIPLIRIAPLVSEPDAEGSQREVGQEPRR